MTSPEQIQDKIFKGMGAAARKTGCSYTLYRPKCQDNPIQNRNRVLKLFAIIEPQKMDVSSGSTWIGTLDGAYTRPGDYLVGRQHTFFIGAQLLSTPAYCVITNRVVSIFRPPLAVQGGYNGTYAVGGNTVIQDWPANLLQSSGPKIERTANGIQSTWTLLLPHLPISVQAADVVTDDLGSSYIVCAAAEDVLGWRATLKQLSS